MREHLPENYLESLQKNQIGRNDLIHNPEVLFQSFAFDKSIIKSLQLLDDFSSMKVLDVGCGDGGSLINLIKAGFEPVNITGIDILEDRIENAKRRFPNISFLNADAAKLPLKDCEFDLVIESTMFVQLTDISLCKAIAEEMIRVVKTNGHIMLIDWRYSKPWSVKYKGLSNKQLNLLFDVNSRTRLMSTKNGALIPFIGRYISKNCSSIYFLVQKLFPFLAGQVTYLLKKTA